MVQKREVKNFLQKKDFEHKQTEATIISFEEKMENSFNGVAFSKPRLNNKLAIQFEGKEHTLDYIPQIDINRLIDKYGTNEALWVGKPILFRSKLFQIDNTGKRQLQWEVIAGVE